MNAWLSCPQTASEKECFDKSLVVEPREQRQQTNWENKIKIKIIKNNKNKYYYCCCCFIIPLLLLSLLFIYILIFIVVIGGDDDGNDGCFWGSFFSPLFSLFSFFFTLSNTTHHTLIIKYIYLFSKFQYDNIFSYYFFLNTIYILSITIIIFTIFISLSFFLFLFLFNS